MTKVVITGRGVVCPLGESVPAMLAGLAGNAVAVEPAPWVSDDRRYFAWWAVVKGFDPNAWMDATIVSGTDLFSQFAIAAAEQSVQDAGLTGFDQRRTAIVHGSSYGGARALLKAQHVQDRFGPEAIDRKTMIQFLPNMAASQLSMRWDLHGPQLTICTACASSIDAIGTAARMIADGRVDVAIAGGTEGGLPAADGSQDGDFVPAMYHCQSAYGMTTGEPDPRKASRPFDTGRTGIVTGEGSAMLVLESEEHALARGATIYAEVAGYGSLADGFHPSSPEPTGRWEAEAMREALADAGVRPDEVDALIAHGTATPKGDAAELRAINTVFKARPGLPVTSLKGHMGHTGAASGAMNAIVAMDVMGGGVLPNTAGTVDPEPEIEFDLVLGEPRTIADASVVQMNSFGFGGQNSSLILRAAR